MSEKRPLVLWSGGTDSTCLVIDLLQQNDIDIMYVNLDNNVKQQRQEKKAITKLKCIIKDANLKGQIINEHAFGYESIDVSKSVYAQPALWVVAASYIADVKMHDSVQVAFVKHDDAWHYKTEIHNVYNAMNNLICDGDIVPLTFPYEWNTKVDLVDNMESFMYHKQVMNLIYYCESGEKEHCGECPSCKRHKSELGNE